MLLLKTLFFQASVLSISNTFDDIIEAITGAIQSAFDGLLGGIFDRLETEINRIILEFFQEQITNIYNWLSSLVLTFSGNVFSNDLVVSWFSVVSLLAKLCFFVGLTLYISNVCIRMSEGRKLMVLNDLKSYVLYLGLGWFGVDGAVLLFRETNNFFANHLIAEGIDSIESAVFINTMGIDDMITLEIIVLIIVIICFVVFLVNIMKRIGYLFALISVIPIYMLSFSKGYSNGFFSWLRLFVSCTVTFFLQYFMFYLGINLLISNAFVLSIIFFLSVPVVPGVLAQFGSGSTSIGDLLSDVAGTAKQGVSTATKVAGMM